MFWRISYHLGAFGIVKLSNGTRGKTFRTSATKFVPRSRIGISHDERTRSTPYDPKLMFGAFCTIWVHLGLLSCLTKLGAKRSELVQKFVTRSRVGVYHDERTRSTPIGP